MSEDEDDPVVSEASCERCTIAQAQVHKKIKVIPLSLRTPNIMPVFLSHALENQLFVFQYPTRPAALPQDNDNIIKCCFKPNNQELLMEVAVDPNSPNYDVSHGEQIAINVDGGKTRTPSDKYFQSTVMDKRMLQSTRVLADAGSVAVATVRNRQLILSPVRGVLSVGPSFPHLDVTDRRAREELKEQGEDVSGGEEEEAEKQVTVKFARQESDRVKKAREQSYNFLSKRSAEEKWYQTQYHPPGSRIAELEKTKLTSTELEDRMGSMCLTPRQYMDSLVPVQVDPTWELPSMPSNITSLTALSNLPLPDIVLAILKQVKIMTFRQLSSLLAGAGGSDEVKLLRSVQQVAVLVRGNWVVRSECLYARDSVSPHNGVAAEVMCRARDYILYQLSEGKVLLRKQVAATVALPPEELRELLAQVARLRRNKGWELALPPDNEFIQRNPEVVERQARAWTTKYKQLMETLQDKPCGRPRHRKDSSVSSDAESGAEGGRRKRSSESSPTKRKKQNSESSEKNGKRRIKTEIPSPEKCL